VGKACWRFTLRQRCDLAALRQPAAHGAANREGNNAKMGSLHDSRNNRQERFYGYPAVIKAEAVLITPEGGQVIAEIECDTRQGSAVLRMVAKLANEGWEPMPVYYGAYEAYEEPILWLFKRPKSANAS